MRKVQKSRLKQKLIEQRTLIQKGVRIGMQQSMSGEIINAFGGIMDEGDISLHDQFEKMHYLRLSSMRKTMKQIETALERLRNGEYGVCEECGGGIGIERLRIVPYTLHCRECQETNELQERRRN